MEAPAQSREVSLRFLAAAVSGQELGVKSSKNAFSWCDGEQIYLAENHGAATVVLQAALVATGCFVSPVISSLIGRSNLERRYLVLEVVRAGAELGFLAPPLLTSACSQLALSVIPRSAEESLEIALSKSEIPKPPDWFGVIKPAKIISKKVKPETTVGLKKRRISLKKAVSSADSDTAEKDNLSSPSKDGAGISNPLANLLRKILGSERSGSTLSAGGSELQSEATKGSALFAIAKQAVGALQLFGTANIANGSAKKVYPEWDGRVGAYRLAWCAVHETAQVFQDDITPLEVKDEPKLRRSLGRLGLAHERYFRQVSGEGIDLEALINYSIHRAAGIDHDLRVYECRRKTAHDLSALVLLDATGSTAVQGDQQRIFDGQRQVAAQLLTTLEDLGDRVAGYAFRAWGRHNVQVIPLKHFDERMDISVRRKMANLSPSGFTRLGAAIRHGTSTLSMQGGTANRLLVVVGDGFPYDDGYENEYARNDVKKALSEALEAGVGCACVTITDDKNEFSVSSVWGEVPYVSLTNPSELHKNVLQIFKGGLRQAKVKGRDARSRMVKNKSI